MPHQGIRTRPRSEVALRAQLFPTFHVTTSGGAIQKAGTVVKDLLTEGVDVYLNVKNHYEGCAPWTIERIEGMLDGG